MKTEMLSLTINADDGKLFVLLTDLKRFNVHGWARTDLLNIRSIASTTAPAVIQELLLPISVNEAIENSDATSLVVQIEPDLSFLPIENFVVSASRQRWCKRFSMVHYISNLEPAGETDQKGGNTLNEQLGVCFTTEVYKKHDLSALTSCLTQNGLSLVHDDVQENYATVLISCSADDAVAFLRNRKERLPDICIWPVDSWAGKAGIDIKNFSLKFPACQILIGQGFDSVEDLSIRLTPALRDMNAGIVPSRAVQSVLRQEANEYQTLRLFNSDDSALCRPSLITPLETENRTITAMSLDLVASTQMMQRIGNEHYSEVLAALKERCIKCIYDGKGSSGGRAGDDSIMAYFGLPNALENTARCAMQTALAVRSILPNLPGQPELRIGIATGRVAVRAGVPYGQAIHLAARLQADGQPGDITLDAASQWLARHDFDFETSADYTRFKGIDHPVLPVKLIDYSALETPENPNKGTVPFIGRAAELKELGEYWEQVCQGNPRVVCVRGEAGIGKSRLVRHFLAEVLPKSAKLLKMNGLSDHHGGVYYSLKECFRRGFGLQAGDSRSTIFQRIQKVSHLPTKTARNLAKVAELLGINDVESQADTKVQPHNNDLRIGETLCELMKEAIGVGARSGPMLIIVDDLQWIGPAVREVMENMINELYGQRGLQLFILCTERDDQPCKALPKVNNLYLKRFSTESAFQFIRDVVGEGLPAEAVHRLVTRAEGVPLFLEESARLALDTQTHSKAPFFGIPDSIDSLLMSRLDNLDTTGKYLVQIASVIGRDIEIDLLRNVISVLTSPSSSLNFLEQFEEQLESFREFGVLRDLKAKGPQRLQFRHEMIRDVAYASMWERDRITAHAAVAQVMLDYQTHLFDAQPGMAAHHLTLSEQHKEAATQWEKAARIAADVSANIEAIHNLRSALSSLNHLARDEFTAKQEMRLQLMLAARLIACEGYGAEEVRSAYERAKSLVNQYGSKSDQLKITLGLESVHIMRGELGRAKKLAIAAVELAGDLPDRKLQVTTIIKAQWAFAHVTFHQGFSDKALTLFDQCLEDCRSLIHQSSAVQDPEIICLCYGAWALSEKGSYDTAQKRVTQAVNLAKSRQHRFSEAQALGFFASLALFKGEYSSAIAHADNAIAISEQENFVIWLAHARIIRGRSIALSGDWTEAIVQMEQGYKQWVNTGAVISRAFYLSLISETLLETGKVELAINRIDKAVDIIDRTGEEYHWAEVLRVKGLTEYAQGELTKGDSLMHQAIKIAQSRNKHAFVLRSSTAMAESWASRGRHADAIAAIETAMMPISEGLYTIDLTRAHSLISACKCKLGQILTCCNHLL